MISEFLIPYLLVAKFPFNNPNIYHGPEYTFNFTDTWEKQFSSSSSLVTFRNHFATIKCQNSNSTSLVCFIDSLFEQIYEESDGIFYPPEPKYEKIDCRKKLVCKPFKIIYSKNGIKEVMLAEDGYSLLLANIISTLNVLWINKVDAENGLYYLENKHNKNKCGSTIKVMKLKDNYGNEINKTITDNNKTGINPKSTNLFTLERVDGFDGMKYNYKYETVKSNNCEIEEKFYDDDTVAVRNRLQFYTNRVIMSAHEFISSNEFRWLYTNEGLKLTNHYKSHLILTNIQPAVNTIPIIENSDHYTFHQIY